MKRLGKISMVTLGLVILVQVIGSTVMAFNWAPYEAKSFFWRYLLLICERNANAQKSLAAIV